MAEGETVIARKARSTEVGFETASASGTQLGRGPFQPQPSVGCASSHEGARLPARSDVDPLLWHHGHGGS